MNKKIKKLVEQAKKNVPHGLTPEKWLEVYHENFAELIVRECVAICQDTDGEDNMDAKSGRQDCAVEIIEHFRVEPDLNENLRNRSTYFGNDI